MEDGEQNQARRHLNVGTAAGGMKEASWMRGTMHCSSWRSNHTPFDHKQQRNEIKTNNQAVRTSRAWKYLTRTLPNLATVYFSASSFCLRAFCTLLHRMTSTSSSRATTAVSLASRGSACRGDTQN